MVVSLVFRTPESVEHVFRKHTFIATVNFIGDTISNHKMDDGKQRNYYNFSRVFDKMYSESKLVSPFFPVTFVLENIGNRFRMNVVNFLGLFLEKLASNSDITEFESIIIPRDLF